MAMSDVSTGKDILLGTANAEDARQLRELCEGFGYRVFVSASGKDVQQRLTERQPDVLLLDLAIQGPDGDAVLRGLRGDSRLHDLPVMVLCDASDMATRLRAMELGADDCVTRPYKPEELRKRVDSVRMVGEYRRRLTAVEDELAELRRLDPVSGAGTAAQLKAHLDSEVAHARRYGLPASVLVMGLDRFDALKEQLGSERCDEYVGRLARAIRHTLRGRDRLFRVKPGEFVITLHETDLKGARMAAEHLNRSTVGISASAHRGEKVETVLRFGGAVFPAEGIQSGDELLREALRSYNGLTQGGADSRIFELAS
jgi:diguanylate cyclase (GGDEF)-like protein